MKYKLINTETNEEHLCDKVTIDGFDYYVSDEQATEGVYGYIDFQGGDIKSQESHPFTEEDMIEFAEWRDNYIEELNKWKVDGLKGCDKFTTKELLAIWKEKQTKTVYYR